jgi:hypothetical protein
LLEYWKKECPAQHNFLQRNLIELQDKLRQNITQQEQIFLSKLEQTMKYYDTGEIGPFIEETINAAMQQNFGTVSFQFFSPDSKSTTPPTADQPPVENFVDLSL